MYKSIHTLLWISGEIHFCKIQIRGGWVGGSDQFGKIIQIKNIDNYGRERELIINRPSLTVLTFTPLGCTRPSSVIFH